MCVQTWEVWTPFVSTITSTDTVILSLKLSSMYYTSSENCTHFYLFHTFLRDNLHTVTKNVEVLGHTNCCLPYLITSSFLQWLLQHTHLSHNSVNNEMLYMLVSGHCCSLLSLCNDLSFSATAGTDLEITCIILTVPELHGYPGNNALRNMKKT
jgi:hypothetical protein